MLEDVGGFWRILEDFYCSVTMLRELGLMLNYHGFGIANVESGKGAVCRCAALMGAHSCSLNMVQIWCAYGALRT